MLATCQLEISGWLVLFSHINKTPHSETLTLPFLLTIIIPFLLFIKTNINFTTNMLSIHPISLIAIFTALARGINATEGACSQVEFRQKAMSDCMYQCDPSFEADVMEFDKCIPYAGRWTPECRLIIKKKSMAAPCFCGCAVEFEPDYTMVEKCSGSKEARKKRWEYCELKCMCRGRNEKMEIDGRWPAIEICPSFCDTEVGVEADVEAGVEDEAEAEGRKQLRDEL